MSGEPNPYQAPLEGDSDHIDLQPFQGWKDRWMVGIFFLPSLVLTGTVLGFFILGSAGLFSKIGAKVILACFALLAIGVSVFSAYVNMCRQRSGIGNLILMIVVYLIAQIFALFLTVVVIIFFVQLV